MHHPLDPAELVLPRRPVTEGGVDVVVDQPRHDGAATRLDDPLGLEAASDGGDAAVLDQDRVGIQHRLGDVAREDEAKAPDHHARHAILPTGKLT
jgi:hypothetical protein